MARFSKYILWQSNKRGSQSRDCKVIECSSLDSAMNYYELFPFKSMVWIEPVRVS